MAGKTENLIKNRVQQGIRQKKKLSPYSVSFIMYGFSLT